MHALDRSLGTSLQDAAAPLLTLLLQLRQEESGESDALRSSLEAAFADFERRASAADYDPQTLQRSKSILAAFADELLQRSMPAHARGLGRTSPGGAFELR
jgi:type VI protein secretion system component VasF